MTHFRCQKLEAITTKAINACVPHPESLLVGSAGKSFCCISGLSEHYVQTSQQFLQHCSLLPNRLLQSITGYSRQ